MRGSQPGGMQESSRNQLLRAFRQLQPALCMLKSAEIPFSRTQL